MKKFFAALFVSALVMFVTAGTLMAQPPDPRDSMIIESKAVDTALTGTPAAPAFFVKLYITNKDSLTYMVVALRESTTTGTAYALLSRTVSGILTFGSIVNPLTNTLRYFAASTVTGYTDNSPDRFLVTGGFDGTDPATIEEPNAARKAVWEFRFRHSSGYDSIGVVRFDSTRVNAQPCSFVNTQPVDVSVNFVPGRLHVCPGADSLNCAPTDVRDVRRGVIPGQYALSQNYPNPFNANTLISFALPKAGKVTLEVFNVLGQKVNTLVNEYMTAGYKIVNWDGRDAQGNNVASGIYFYRLLAEDFKQTKKMLLIE